jgi:hypothetical protein
VATRARVTIKSQLHDVALIVEWSGLLAGDDGSWELLGHYNDKCLHVFGVFGGAIVTVEGSNEDIQTNPVGLTDPTQTPISLSALGLKQVLENPLYVRPRVTGGDGTTALTARLVCRS